MDNLFIIVFAGVLSFLGWNVNLRNIENGKIGRTHKVELPKDKPKEQWTSEDVLKSDLGVDDVRKLKYKRIGTVKGGKPKYRFANPETNKIQDQVVNPRTRKIDSIWNPLNKNYEDPYPPRDFGFTREESREIRDTSREYLERKSEKQKQRDESGSIKDWMFSKLNLDYSDWNDVEK